MKIIHPPTMASLWSGTGSQHAAWEDAGYRIASVEINPKFNPTMLTDILNVTADDIREELMVDRPTWLWASVDCSTFSLATRIRHYDRHFQPITEKGEYMMKRLIHTLELIAELDPLFFLVENPRGLMRKLPIMQKYHRHTVTYCQYEEQHAMKMTDLFGIVPQGWFPQCCQYTRGVKEMPCHPFTPRGAKWGTQGKSKADRGKIPYGLGESLVLATVKSGFQRARSILEDWTRIHE